MREKIQQEILNLLEQNDWRGTIIASVGLGKSFIAYGMISNFPNSSGAIISYTSDQSKNIEKERVKYEFLKGKLDCNIDYFCYAGKRDISKYDWLILDEFDVAGLELLKPFKDFKKPMLAMSGTAKLNSNPLQNENVFRQQDSLTKKGVVTESISKAQLYQIYLPPIIFRYSYNEAKKDGIVGDFKVKIWDHLPGLNIIEAKVGFKEFKGTEKSWFNQANKVRNNPYYNDYLKKRINVTQIPQVLHNLPSKIDRIKSEIVYLEGQTIIFGKSLNLLRQITPYTLQGNTSNFTLKKDGLWYYRKTKTKYFVRNSKLKETEITKESYDAAKNYFKDNKETNLIDRFNSKEINLIASSKKIGRGMNFSQVDNIILASYDSTLEDFIQKVGRGIRDPNKILNLFIIRTLGTFEEKWIEKMQFSYNDKGELIDYIKIL